MDPYYPVEQVREATTPNEMRSEIHRLRHESPLVRAVMNTSDFNGLSAEDRYTMLAYHALKDSAQARKAVYDHLVILPNPPIVVAEK